MATTHRRAAILSIGDEIALGQTLDTNSQWLSAQLLERGIVPVEHVTVADDAAAIANALRRLAATVDVIVVTGGLGPTPDDLTRQGLAAAAGSALEEDQGALESIREYFARLSRSMPETNRVQALVPRGASCLPNDHGTAPGIAAVVGGCDVCCLPGPPREMHPMFEVHVAPRLRPAPGQPVRTRVLHTVGLPESDVAARLGDLMERQRTPLVGTTASGALVSCRIRDERSGDVSPSIEDIERQVRERLAPHVFGVDEQTLPSVVLERLREASATVATVESCTGGLIGKMLTDVPGSSDAYTGGWITYTNRMKQDEVGVPAWLFEPGGPGAVSRECAWSMAAGGLERSGAVHCLAVTGIAGPTGSTNEKPVGTVWIALASKGPGLDVRCFQLSGDRESIRDWSAKLALGMLYLRLAGAEGTRLIRQIGG